MYGATPVSTGGGRGIDPPAAACAVAKTAAPDDTAAIARQWVRQMVQAAFARVAAAVVGVLLAWSPPAAGAEPVAAAMRIQDLSQSTRCAEDDNVYVALSGGDVRRFEIGRAHV